MEQELKQDGVIKEPPREEISKAVPEVSPVEKETSKRTEGEFRKIQSLKDKAESRLQAVEKELQELHKDREQQRLEARKREIEGLEGDAEGQSHAKRKHQLEDEVRTLEEKKVKEDGAVQRKYDQALDLAKQHSLSLEDARELMTAESPREMELLAQLKAMEKEKGVKSGFKPDSGVSESGELDEKKIRSDYMKDPTNPKNIERYRKLRK